ncbi:hypothetical protein HD806DRAFT_475747 [Xylariaceae sp. AK1471]|nr:hypothetical protein HD806DRAFT_475747 [Xylariaceae sp. AK1471]
MASVGIMALWLSAPTGPDPTVRIGCPDLRRRCHPRNPVREARPSRDYCQILLMNVQGLLWAKIHAMSMTSLEAGPS